MAKLFPPTIDGKLPAAVYVDDKLCHLHIPFQHNSAIGENSYQGYCIKIKTAATDLQVALHSFEKSEISGNEINKQVEFKEGTLQIGQFYKVQLAYADVNGDAGLYSTVGVFKCTTNNVEAAIIVNNALDMSVSGQYIPSNSDITEVEYSYEFQIYNNKNQLLMTSGELLHNSQDNSDGQDSYTFGEMLQYGNYKLKYIVTTINKLVYSIEKPFILTEETAPLDLNFTAELINSDCGNIKISILNNIDNNIYLLRKDDEKWQVLDKILNGTSGYSFIDNTTEQGIIYSYCLGYQIKTEVQEQEQYTIWMNEPRTVESDYNSIQLSDENKQLQIIFNPKISSYKNVIQEQKQDTIGGQYPFIFRNGNMRYREIGISGLISYHMDSDNLFIHNKEKIGLDNDDTRVQPVATNVENIRNKTTQLVGYNIAAERKFRNYVEEWLNNGKPKLFRSPTEGCYIVRLMNVSLTPEDQVGRMLYNFSATAYEIDKINLDKLKEYNLIWGKQNV